MDSQSEVSPQRSAGKTIARNTLFGIGAQLALRVASFIFQIAVVRTLGGETFGQYTIVLAWAGLFSVIGDLGVQQYLAREIARDTSRKDVLFWNTVALRFVLAIVAGVVTVVGAIQFTNYSEAIIIGIAIYTSSFFIQAILAPMYGILTGYERVDITSISLVMTQVLFMIFASLFLFMGLDFTWLVLANVINLPLILFFQIRVLRRDKISIPPFEIDWRMWKGLLIAGLPFGLIQLALSFTFQVDTIMLSSAVSDYEVGLYSVAYNLTLNIVRLASAFNMAVLPTLAREHATDPDSIKPWYYGSVKIILFITLPIAVGGMLTAPAIIETLYQPDILPAAAVLMILVWDIPFVIYHGFCGNITQSIKREGAAARVFIIIGILNVILNFIFIPRFGIVGAALSTVITDTTGALLFYFILRAEFGAGLGFNRLSRIVLAAGLMGVIIYIIQDLNIVLVIGISGLIYLVTVWFSGALSPAEAARLTGLFNRIIPARK
jgi:O-antigen/teichoic acid export membrane protein